jgi:hypothetical protein
MSKIPELPKQENQGTAPGKVASPWPYLPLSPIELRVAPPGRGRAILAKGLTAEKRDV